MPIAPLVPPRPRPTPAIVFGTDGLIRLSKFTSDEFSPKNDCGVLVEGFFVDSGSRSSKNEAITQDWFDQCRLYVKVAEQALQLLLLVPFIGVVLILFVITSNSSRSELGDC